MEQGWLTWQQFERIAKRMAREIEPLVKGGEVDSLYGIPRGGMVVAVRLSYILNIPIVEFSQISETTLIVDDILGSGRTAREVLRQVPSKQLASLVYAEDAELPPGLKTFVGGRRIPGNIFIKMPWAPEDTIH